MQLNCPNCAQTVAADHIHIQAMTVLCPNCETIFHVNTQDSKLKRRKVKQPQHLTVHDGDNLHMSFRTNFRLLKNRAFINLMIAISLFNYTTIEGFEDFFRGEGGLFLPILCLLGLLGVLYLMTLLVFNKTHIEMDEEKIRITRKPLPSLRSQLNEVNLAGVVAIRCEETAISIKEQYDTPRYNVWAEMMTADRRTIVTDVIEDYGYFIAQRIEEQLHYDHHLDTVHLEDNGVSTSDDMYPQVDEPLLQHQ